MENKTYQTPKAFSKLEAVAHYTEFVRAYSSYGTEMIELANLICKWLTRHRIRMKIDS